MRRGVVFDLDGVIRHFTSGITERVAAEHGIEPGQLIEAAFLSGLLEEVVSGQITKHQWIERVGLMVGIPDVAEIFLRDRGTVDDAMIATVNRLRSDGFVVAILTNGTDAIPEELADLGIAHHFDEVFNSHFIGAAKPSPVPFEHVSAALELAPRQLFFTDDRADNVATAQSLGWAGYHFVSVAGFETALAEWLSATS